MSLVSASRLVRPGLAPAADSSNFELPSFVLCADERPADFPRSFIKFPRARLVSLRACWCRVTKSATQKQVTICGNRKAHTVLGIFCAIIVPVPLARIKSGREPDGKNSGPSLKETICAAHHPAGWRIVNSPAPRPAVARCPHPAEGWRAVSPSANKGA